MSQEKYQPTPEEVQKAEEMMTPKQTEMSENRETVMERFNAIYEGLKQEIVDDKLEEPNSWKLTEILDEEFNEAWSAFYAEHAKEKGNSYWNDGQYNHAIGKLEQDPRFRLDKEDEQRDPKKFELRKRAWRKFYRGMFIQSMGSLDDYANDRAGELYFSGMNAYTGVNVGMHHLDLSDDIVRHLKDRLDTATKTRNQRKT